MVEPTTSIFNQKKAPVHGRHNIYSLNVTALLHEATMGYQTVADNYWIQSIKGGHLLAMAMRADLYSTIYMKQITDLPFPGTVRL